MRVTDEEDSATFAVFVAYPTDACVTRFVALGRPDHARRAADCLNPYTQGSEIAS